MDTQPTANCCPKCQTALPPDAPQGLCPKCLFAAVATPTEADQPAGNRPTPPALTEIAAAFPQLEILEFIGQGGMGFVFKARQPKLDRLVALKILPQSLAADPTFAERFNREAKLLARLNHPGIVAVHDFGVVVAAGILPAGEPGVPPGRKGAEISGALPNSEAIASSSANPGGKMPPSTSGRRPDATRFYYLLMEFVDGVNLRQAMQAGRFTPDQALAIVPKICEALQFAHNEGILHRDIKPENILLDARGRVKIADFGIAKLVEGRAGSPLPAAESPNTNGAQGTARPTNELTEAGKTLGSPNYMAPEQLEHPGEVDHRADIYSLGVVFYEMLTGELPRGRFAPPSQKSAADPRVDEVVLRALEKERERRQHSAGEVRTQVETIAATPPGSSRGLPRQSETTAGEKAQIEKAESGKRKAEIAPRFSRTAIVGSCWIAFAFFTPLALYFASYNAGPDYHGPPRWQPFLFWLLLPFGITAPFGTTFLGWIAVSQIRRSAGTLYGMWLAVFDGLLFPLLVLDALIILWLNHTSGFSLPYSPSVNFILICALVLAGDVFIIRRVWRAVNQPTGVVTQIPENGNPSSPKAAEFGKVKVLSPALMTVAWHAVLLLAMFGFLIFVVPRFVAEFSGFDAQLPRSTRLTLQLGSIILRGGLLLLPALLALDAGVCILIQYLAGRRLRNVWSALVVSACAVLCLGAAWSLMLPLSSWEKPEAPQHSTPDAAQNPSFGPEIKLQLNSITTDSGYVDFDTGESCSHQTWNQWKLLSGSFTEWALQRGVDFGFFTNESSQAVELAGFDLGIYVFPEVQRPGVETRWANVWNRLSADRLLEQELHGLLTNREPRMLLGTTNFVGRTIAFETREGGVGLLQITGFTENPRGVKLRYKLVQDSASTKPATSSIAARVAGGELEIIAVRKYPAAPSSRWWSPEGRPSEVLPAVRAGEYPAAPPGSVGVELLVREAFPDGAYPLETRFYPAQGMPQKDTFICHLSADPKATAMDATFQIASGPWQDVGRQEGQMSVNENGGVDFMVARFQSAAGGVEWRIVAVDADGVEHPHNASIQLTSGPDTGRTTFTFGGRFAKAADRGLVVQSVTEFRLQRREGHAVIFHNISLQPGHSTTVEVVDDSVKQTQKQKNTP